MLLSLTVCTMIPIILATETCPVALRVAEETGHFAPRSFRSHYYSPIEKSTNLTVNLLVPFLKSFYTSTDHVLNTMDIFLEGGI